MAAIAGTGGVMAIAVAIGVPIWMSLHGRPYVPTFSLFACWGFAALGGAYACLHTYFLTDTLPPRPPGSGLPISVLRSTAALGVVKPPADATDRRAA
jgi:hypothetical protein